MRGRRRFGARPAEEPKVIDGPMRRKDDRRFRLCGVPEEHREREAE
jgi:hypothetical protein